MRLPVLVVLRPAIGDPGLNQGAHAIGDGSSPRGWPMPVGAGGHGTSSTPTTRTNCEHPVSGDDLTGRGRSDKPASAGFLAS